MKEYLAIGNVGCLYSNRLRGLIVAWLNASHSTWLPDPALYEKILIFYDITIDQFLRNIAVSHYINLEFDPSALAMICGLHRLNMNAVLGVLSS